MTSSRKSLRRSPSQLKLGKYDDLSDEDQERVENEAEAAADKWMDEAEDASKEPTTPFEKLLAEYTAIALKFPEDEDDEEDDEDEDDHKDDHKDEQKPHK